MIMYFRTKHINKLLLFFYFLILINCQFQEPYKNHGIVFLENRSNKLVLNTSNKNDVIKIFGEPHTVSFKNDNEWIYIERVLSKGEYHKLGQNILKTNNVLILSFNKYGVLVDKKILYKRDLQKVKFSTDKTENELSKKSFVEKFLSSVRSKMYKNK